MKAKRIKLQSPEEWALRATIWVVGLGIGATGGYILGRRSARNHALQEVIKDEVKKINDGLEELKSEQIQLDFKMEEDKQKMRHMMQEAQHVVREFKEDGQKFLEQAEERTNNPIHVHIPDNLPEYEVDEEDYEKEREELEEYEEDDDNDDDEEEQRVSIFNSPNEDPNWDYEEEEKNRTTDRPYIIHVNEYFDEEKGYSHSTLTYYQGDDVLADELDTPIYDPQKVVGTLQFGKGSNDPNVVYVRNDTLSAEYEILLDRGLYQVEVLQQPGPGKSEEVDDLKHEMGIRKFRLDE